MSENQVATSDDLLSQLMSGISAERDNYSSSDDLSVIEDLVIPAEIVTNVEAPAMTLDIAEMNAALAGAIDVETESPQPTEVELISHPASNDPSIQSSDSLNDAISLDVQQFSQPFMTVDIAEMNAALADSIRFSEAASEVASSAIDVDVDVDVESLFSSGVATDGVAAVESQVGLSESDRLDESALFASVNSAEAFDGIEVAASEMFGVSADHLDAQADSKTANDDPEQEKLPVSIEDMTEDEFFSHISSKSGMQLSPSVVEMLKAASQKGIERNLIVAMADLVYDKILQPKQLPLIIPFATMVNGQPNAAGLLALKSGEIAVANSGIGESGSHQLNSGDGDENRQVSNGAKSNFLTSLFSSFNRNKVNDEILNVSQLDKEIIPFMNSVSKVLSSIDALKQTARGQSISTLKAHSVPDDVICKTASSMPDAVYDGVLTQLNDDLIVVERSMEKILARAKTESDVNFIRSEIAPKINDIKDLIQSDLSGYPDENKGELKNKLDSVIESINKKIEAIVNRIVSQLVSAISVVKPKLAAPAP